MSNQNNNLLPPLWTTSRVALATLIILAVGFSFWLLYQVRGAIFILFIAIVIGTAVRPVIERLAHWQMPRRMAAVAVYLLVLITFVSFGLLLLPLLFEQVAMIVDNLPDYYQEFRNTLAYSSNLMLQQIGRQLPMDLTGLSLVDNSEPVVDETVNSGTSYLDLIFRGTFTTIATLVLSFYWTIDGRRSLRGLLLLIPNNRREDISELVIAMETKVGAFIRGQAILCGAIGSLALVAYLLIGLPHALLLAVIAGIMEAIPVIGPTLGAVPAILVVVASDPSKIIWIIVATLAIQQIENTFLLPRVMDKSVGVNPVVTLLAFFTFGSLLGVMGAVMAIPIAAMIQLLLDRYIFNSPPDATQEVDGRGPHSVIQYEVQELVQDVRKHLRAKGILSGEETDRIEEEIEAIAVDLNSLLAQTDADEVTP